MKKVILFANPNRDEGLSCLQKVKEIAEQTGLMVQVLDGLCVDAPSAPDAGLAVTFGGDGAILRAARVLCRTGVPILGVNLGHKGFMAELEPGELELVREAFQGSFAVEERMMADVAVYRDGQALFRDFALNEAVAAGLNRVVGISVYGDGRRIMGFDGDGVIVSTPTGSTAYSLSAGGPIVEPTAKSLVVTPVCPHILAARSYVLSPERTVTVELRALEGKRAYLSVDGGEGVELDARDRVEVKKSELVTRLARVTKRSFYEKVAAKLGDRL